MAKKVILGTDIARDAFKVKANENFTELYNKDVELGEQINSLDAQAKDFTKHVLVTEVFNSAALTTINLGFKPDLVIIEASILATKYKSTGYVHTSGQNAKFSANDGFTSIAGGNCVVFRETAGNSSNSVSGIATIKETGLEIAWTVAGTLTAGTGNRRLIVTAFRKVV